MQMKEKSREEYRGYPGTVSDVDWRFNQTERRKAKRVITGYLEVWTGERENDWLCVIEMSNSFPREFDG